MRKILRGCDVEILLVLAFGLVAYGLYARGGPAVGPGQAPGYQGGQTFLNQQLRQTPQLGETDFSASNIVNSLFQSAQKGFNVSQQDGGGDGGSSFSGGTSAGIAVGAASAAIGIFAGLWAAHEKRISQAKDENTAVTLAQQQVDEVVKTVFQYMNSHQATPDQGRAMLTQAWSMYWQIIGNHIQPGRNGCANGAAIQTFPGVVYSMGEKIPIGTYKGCGDIKDWGAACCIGSVIKSSLANMLRLTYYPHNTAKMFKIFPSIYGNPGREEYLVTYNG
jgi:hypothetical protein